MKERKQPERKRRESLKMTKTQEQEPFNRLLLDAIPHPAMLVRRDNTILAANKKALEIGAKIGGCCWRDFAHAEYIPEEDKRFLREHPGDMPPAGIKCTFCLADEAFAASEPTNNPKVSAFGQIWDVYWIPVGSDVYLHYAINITERKKVEEELKRHRDHLEQLVEERTEEIRRNSDIQNVINDVLRLSLENVALEDILKHSLDRILSIPWLAAQARGAMFLVEDEPAVLVMKAQKGLTEQIGKTCALVPFGKCLCGRAALTEEIQFADGLDERHGIRYEGIYSHGHYCVPILFAGKALGVICIYLNEGHRCNPREEEFLTSVANTLAGVTMRQRAEVSLKQSLTKLQKTLEASVSALSSIAEMRDPYTAGHQRRVALIATAIAREMNLSDDQINAIGIAGQIYDIGKIVVPAEILSKPGKLSNFEFGIVQSHAKLGYETLKNLEFPWDVADIIFEHHERLNGSGYPQGLTGNDILLEAKILAVSDTVEAMASHRPYRPALGVDKALLEILQKKGILYDSEVVDACLKLFTERGFKFE